MHSLSGALHLELSIYLADIKMTAKTLLEKLQSGGLIAAHRGHRSLFPENTLAAFQDCPGKCDFIELDVRFSKDGVPVVFHDHTLERTTDIQHCGKFPGRESNLLETFNFCELQQLDIGTWFYQTDPWGQISQGAAPLPQSDLQSQTMSDLGSILSFVKHKELSVNVEIKSLHDNETKSAFTVLQLIHDHGVDDQCVVSAFNHDILRLMKSLDSEVVTAALVEIEHPANILNYLQTNDFQGYHIEDSMVNIAIIKELQSAGIFVSVYTVNKERRKQALFDMGVSAVITDFL